MKRKKAMIEIEIIESEMVEIIEARKVRDQFCTCMMKTYILMCVSILNAPAGSGLGLKPPIVLNLLGLGFKRCYIMQA